MACGRISSLGFSLADFVVDDADELEGLKQTN